MKPPLSPTAHGVLEYASVPVWIYGATSLGLAGTALVLAWVLAGGVLAAATLTDYPLAVVRLVPLRVHAWVDRCVTPLVIAAPWLLRFEDRSARELFAVMGTIGLIVTWLTNFHAEDRSITWGAREGPSNL